MFGLLSFVKNFQSEGRYGSIGYISSGKGVPQEWILSTTLFNIAMNSVHRFSTQELSTSCMSITCFYISQLNVLKIQN